MTPTRNCEVHYEMYIDGASRGNPGPAGVGVVLLDGNAKSVQQFGKYIGQATNNVAEYLALIYGLQAAVRVGAVSISVRTDSELLARQVNGRYRVRDAHLRLFHDLAVDLLSGFQRCSVEHIPRSLNTLADRLAGQAIVNATRSAGRASLFDN